MKVVAIVVTFNPELITLNSLLSAVSGQVGSVVVVDNGSGERFGQWFDSLDWPNLYGIFLDSNKGVATAQNVGIERARQDDADYVILFDQDSLPMPDMVDRLLAVAEEKQKVGEKVAVVGPRFVDERNQSQHSFLRVNAFTVNKLYCDSKGDELISDVIISSGSLIPMPILKEIGGMVDELFIDMVDIEWCLRARDRGYLSYGVCDAVMYHSLGDEPLNVWGRTFPRHSPLRHYYIARNSIWLLSRSYVPPRWKLLLIRAVITRLIFFPVWVSPRWSYLKKMLSGFGHGVLGRMGKLE